MSLDLKKQSNPFSTGGGGVNFETRVQASFAIALITQSCVPCLSKNMRAKELKFQNKYAGPNTDDFVLEASDKYGATSKLYAQIKHEITIGASTGSEENSSTFSDVIKSAWEDFKQSNFDRTKDKIALITGPLSQVDITNTLPLLEWAKYSANADEFIKKIETKGFASQAKLKKLEAFKIQLKHANEDVAITNEELWEFLKVFYLVSFDLDTEHSIVKNLLCSLIQMYSDELPSLVLSKVTTCVQEFNQNAGTLTLKNLPDDVKKLFTLNIKTDFESDLLKLQDHGNHIFNGISNLIQGFHVDRHEELISISEAVNENDFVFVTGVRGTGKSGIVKDFVLSKNEDVPIFYFRAEDFDKSHLNEVFYSIGINSSLTQIESYFSLIPKKILVIESIEKILELDYQHAFIDLLQFIRQQTGWKIIATGRDYALQQLSFNFLQSNGIKFTSINIEAFSEEQVQQVSENIPELKNLLSNETLIDILRVPFFIDIAVRAIGNGAQFQSGDTEIDFRNTVWSSVIAKEQFRKSSMPIKRRKTFIEIATQRAKKMVFGISVNGFDFEVIAKLEEDNLIYRDPKSSTISLTHDVLEDWALEEFIEEQFQSNSNELSTFLKTIGNEPAISRAFRLWLYHRLQFDKSTYDFVEKLLNSNIIESFWKDETIAAILQHDNPSEILELLKDVLFIDDSALLIRFCFILRITCQRPNPRFSEGFKLDKKSGIIQTLFLEPQGKGWVALLNFIYKYKNDLSLSIISHLIELISDWSEILDLYKNFPEESRTVGLLSLWLLEPIKNEYDKEKERAKIIGILLRLSPEIQNEFNDLMSKDVFVTIEKYRRLNYVNELINIAFFGTYVPFICKYQPDFIINLALNEWIIDENERNNEYRFSNFDMEGLFGLDSERDFFPASGAKGPFKYLLHFHPIKALDFIIKLCNSTSKKYGMSQPEKNLFSVDFHISHIEMNLDDGTIVKQIASSFLWNAYRGLSTVPYLLQCALMALENWLIDLINNHSINDNIIHNIYLHLLKNSNSVMITSVLASVSIAFPDKLKEVSLPLLRIKEFYFYDLKRSINEKGGNELNWFGVNIFGDVMHKIYSEERRVAALRSWRKSSLENLLIKLQFDSQVKDRIFQIVDHLKDQSINNNDTKLIYMINRVDTRNWEVINDQDDKKIIIIKSPEISEELKRDQEKCNDEFAANNSILKLNLWANKLFNDKEILTEYFSSYEDGLEAAQKLLIDLRNQKLVDFAEMATGAITKTASVCIRDNFENLDEENFEWCFNIILQAIEINSDFSDNLTSHDKTDNWGAGACAYVLCKLFKSKLTIEQINDLKVALAIAVTHANQCVNNLAALGIRDFLWSIDQELASNFLNGIVEYAKLQKELELDNRKSYMLEDNNLQKFYNSQREKISEFRRNLISEKFKISVSNISLDNYSQRYIYLSVLMIPLHNQTVEQMELFFRVVNFIFEAKNKKYRLNDEKRFNSDIEISIKDCLVEQLIFDSNKNFDNFKNILISGCMKAPNFIHLIKLSFDVEMHKNSNYEAIWKFWKTIEPELTKIALTDTNIIYRRDEDINELLRGFLHTDTRWEGLPSDRKCIEHGAKFLLNFANQNAKNIHVFESLASWIYNFFDLFFENGIQILAEYFNKNKELILKCSNTIFYLEMSIGRYLQVENRGVLSLKMYNICFSLLTGIIETGSARAYYLREQLIRSRKIAS